MSGKSLFLAVILATCGVSAWAAEGNDAFRFTGQHVVIYEAPPKSACERPLADYPSEVAFPGQQGVSHYYSGGQQPPPEGDAFRPYHSDFP